MFIDRLTFEAFAVNTSTAYSTNQIDFSGLTPETCYEVEVVFTAMDDSSTSGGRGRTPESIPAYSTFDTPPLPSVMRAVRTTFTSLSA